LNAVLAETASPLPYESRAPRGHLGFSWGRFVHPHGVEYRLFRRDLAGKLYIESRRFYHGQARWQVAEHLNLARNALRDRVDAIVLEQLGVIE